MTNQNFEQGQSTSEREAFPEGPAFDQMHTSREYVGYGVLARDTRSQAHMGKSMAENLSVAQMNHSLIWEQRGGTSRKQDYPSGTPPTTNGLHGATRSPSPSGRIKAVQRFDLGEAYGRPGPSGHDPADTPVDTDYFHQADPAPNAYSRYVGVAEILAQPTQRAGLPVDPTSQFETMGDAIFDGFGVGRQ